MGVLGHGPNGKSLSGVFKQVETYEYQDQLGLSILRCIQSIPDGVLVFLPSYSLLEKLFKRWDATGTMKDMKMIKDIYQEPKTAAATFDKVMLDYRKSIDNGRGGLLFAVFRGKMSEGIDFSDRSARAVIAVGIPYPNVYVSLYLLGGSG